MRSNVIKSFSIIAAVLLLSSCSAGERTYVGTETTTNYKESKDNWYEARFETPKTEDITESIKDNFNDIQATYATTTDYPGAEIIEDTPKYSPVIEDATGFYDGIAILKISLSENYNDYGFYAYNYYDETFTLLDIEEMPQCHSGTTAVMDDGSIISLTSGEIIMSSEDDYTQLVKPSIEYITNDEGNYYRYTHDNYYFGDYLIAFKTEEKFDGNVYSMGVIDNNGNWVVPMSSDLIIFDKLSFDKLYQQYHSISSFGYLGNNIVEIGDYAYSFLDDNIICETDGRGWFTTEKSIFVSMRYSDGCYIYNRDTEEWIEYNENIEWISDKGILIEQYDTEKERYINLILDHQFNTIHDLSEYNLSYAYQEGNVQFTDNIAAFTANGASGGKYFCIIDKTDNFSFEPIKTDYNEDNYLLEEDRITLYFDNNTIYDFSTNSKTNIKSSRNNATLFTESYDSETDTYLCKTDIPLEYFGSTPSYYFITSDGKEVLTFPLQLNNATTQIS